jgi:hypothetical protein
VEGFALSDAATGQPGQAVALLAWLAAHRTPRSAQIPAASAGCAVPPKTAISRNLGSPVFRLVRRQAQALPNLLLDDLRRGPRVHGVDVLLAPEDLQDGVGLVVIVPQPDRERLLGVIFPWVSRSLTTDSTRSSPTSSPAAMTRRTCAPILV